MASEAAAAPARAHLRTERVDAREFRQEIIHLFERKGDLVFRRQFDWYYRDQGQPIPISWLARGAEGRVSGLLTAVRRTIRFRDQLLTAGVLGNLITDRSPQAGFVAFALIRAAKALVANHEVDLLLGVPNELAEPVLLKMGFQIIDRWQSYVLVFRSHAPLQHKFGSVGTALSPVLDLVAAVRRLHSEWAHSANPKFSLKRLGDDDIDKLPIEGWRLPKSSFAIDANPSYLRWRFLREPIKTYELIGIADAADGSICGYLVLHAAAGRLHICDCHTDARRLSGAAAILCFCHSELARRNTVWVAALRTAPMLASLAACGFAPVSASVGGYPAFPLIGFWRPDHPLANSFQEAYRWDLLPGFNDV